MKYHPRFILFSLPLILLPLLAFSNPASAQSIEPDKQIVREMIAYIGKLETASTPVPQLPPNTNFSAEKNDRASASLLSLEQQAFQIINQQREENGLPALKWNEDMARAARLHSGNMASLKFFDHRGMDGLTVSDRAKSIASRIWYSIGENIAYSKGFSKPVETACRGWMQSAGHRQNILDPNWTESGIGAAIAADGTFYFTQVFIN
ncbi:MAG: CAP domain-containing protein [Pyrinomonadaceae bacterium]